MFGIGLQIEFQESEMSIGLCEKTALPKVCPRCQNTNVLLDKIENEPYCLACGWRRAVRISTEEARNWNKKDSAAWKRILGN